MGSLWCLPWSSSLRGGSSSDLVLRLLAPPAPDGTGEEEMGRPERVRPGEAVISESDWSAKASSRFMVRGAGDEPPPPEEAGMGLGGYILFYGIYIRNLDRNRDREEADDCAIGLDWIVRVWRRRGRERYRRRKTMRRRRPCPPNRKLARVSYYCNVKGLSCPRPLPSPVFLTPF